QNPSFDSTSLSFLNGFQKFLRHLIHLVAQTWMTWTLTPLRLMIQLKIKP
ncbi:hypothetical protein KSS87_014172, partial [Heliosperma pusillum]